MQGLIEKEDFFVLVQTITGTLSVVVVGQLLFTLFKSSLDDQLILELLACASDGGCCVLEDEFRITLGRKGADQIQLALGYFDDGLLGGIPEDIFAH